MFCGKCGTNNSDDAQFCANCGAPMGGPSVPVSEAPVQESTPVAAPGKNGLARLAGIACAIVAVLVLIIVLFSGRGAKATAKKFMDATFSGNGKTIVNLIPKKIVKSALKESDMSKKEFIKYMDAALEGEMMWLRYYYGEDAKFSFSIDEMEDMKSKDLRELKEEYEDDFGVKIKAAKTVYGVVTIKEKGAKKGDTEDIEFVIVKVGSSWYIDMYSMLDIF